MRSSLVLVTIVALMAGGPTWAAADAPTAASVVTEVQAFYKGIKQAHAGFTQAVTNPTFGTTKKSVGRVWIKKPGKMRWDYQRTKTKKGKATTTVTKSFISDGKTLYVVDYDNKQVIEQSLKDNVLPVAVTFLYGKGDLATDFDAALDTSGTYGDLVVELTPKVASAQYAKLFLVVDQTDSHVTDSVIVDGAGTASRFTFHKPNFKKSVKNGYFEFDKKKVPKYRVITSSSGSSASSGASSQTQTD